jgi:hypothetical protein
VDLQRAVGVGERDARGQQLRHATQDYAPTVRVIQATSPDLEFVDKSV